jgi:hypothetical protein
MRAIQTATAAAAAVALAAGSAGCGAQNESKLMTHEAHAQAPAAIQSACVLAERKCSSCHDLGRLSVARWNGISWEVYVERMRRMPGSGISPDDGMTIVTCLNYVKHLQARSAMADGEDDEARWLIER